MRFPHLAASAGLLLVAGCHSAFIQATVVNNTPDPIALIEVDYPSASFGTENLAAGGAYHYRFKIIGSGATAVLWTDAAHHDHKSAGPVLHEGDEGQLTLTFTATGPTWSTQLHAH